jgi:hypothetical protein
MRIYVKEFGDTFNVQKVKLWIKDGIDVLPLRNTEVVGVRDVITVAKQDDAVIDGMYTVWIWEDVIDVISRAIVSDCESRYDYYYLKYSLEKAKNPSVTTLISGSSYGAMGTDESLLTDAVNLSSLSQDMYYSTLGIYRACENNKNIRNIVLYAAYYLFFSDISREKNPIELSRITKVFYPLYNDMHNCALLPPEENGLYTSDIFDIQRICEYYVSQVVKSGYFHEERERSKYGFFVGGSSKLWGEFTEEEKTEAGKKRTSYHNKLLRYHLSYVENAEIFQQLCNFCTENNIKLLVVVPPATTYYVKAFDTNFKKMFYDVLEKTWGG